MVSAPGLRGENEHIRDRWNSFADKNLHRGDATALPSSSGDLAYPIAPRRHGLAVHLSPNGDGERVGDVAVVIGDGRALKTTMLIHIGHATEQLNNPGQAPSARDRHPLLKDGVGGQLRHRALRVAHQPDKVRTLSP